MADTDAHDAGAALARARWGRSVVSRAVATLQERRGELDEPLKAELREIAGDPLLDITVAQRAGLREIAGDAR